MIYLCVQLFCVIIYNRRLSDCRKTYAIFLLDSRQFHSISLYSHGDKSGQPGWSIHDCSSDNLIVWGNTIPSPLSHGYRFEQQYLINYVADGVRIPPLLPTASLHQSDNYGPTIVIIGLVRINHLNTILWIGVECSWEREMQQCGRE